MGVVEKAKRKFGVVRRHTIHKVTQYKAGGSAAPGAPSKPKKLRVGRVSFKQMASSRKFTDIAKAGLLGVIGDEMIRSRDLLLTPADQATIQADRAASYGTLPVLANVGVDSTFTIACGVADNYQRLANIGVTRDDHIVRGGDMAHDLGYNMVLPIQPPSNRVRYPSMKDYFSRGDVNRAALIESFVRNEKNIRDAFDTFYTENIPRHIRTEQGLRDLTAELIGLGCRDIILDAQFGNLFTEGFGAGMRLLEGAVFYCDGASKVSSAAARGDVASLPDPTPFVVPFFVGNSRHVFKHDDTGNVIHVFPEAASDNGFSLFCRRGLSVNALCAVCGLDGSRGSGEAGEPVAIQTTYAGADYGNQIIMGKPITDWSELVYSLLKTRPGEYNVLITNDFFLYKLALAAGVKVIIRTISTSSRYIEVYIDPTVRVLTAAETATINQQLVVVNRAAVVERIGALQEAFTDTIEGGNIPESLEQYIENGFNEMGIKINAIADTIDTLAGYPIGDARRDLNKVRGLLTQTAEGYLDAVLDEMRMTLYNSVNNYISRIQLRKKQIKALELMKTDAVTVPDFLRAVRSLDLPAPEEDEGMGVAAAGGGGAGDRGGINVLNSIYLGVDIQQSAKRLIATLARSMFGGEVYAPVKRNFWRIDGPNAWIETLNPHAGGQDGGGYIQSGGGETEVLALARQVQPSHTKGFTTADVDPYFSVLRDDPDIEVRFAAFFKIMKAVANEMWETNMWDYFESAYNDLEASLIEDSGEEEDTPTAIMSDVPARKVLNMMTNETYGEVFFNVMSRTAENPQMPLFVDALEDFIKNPFSLPPYAAIYAYCDSTIEDIEEYEEVPPPTGPTTSVIGPNGSIRKVPVKNTRKNVGYGRIMTIANLPKEQTPTTGLYDVVTSAAGPVMRGRGGARRRRTRRRGSRAAARRARTFRRRK